MGTWCCAGPPPACSTPNGPSAASRATNRCRSSWPRSTDTPTPSTPTTPKLSVPPPKVHPGSSPKFHETRDMLGFVVCGHESRRPQVDVQGSAATAMLGLPGFVLLAVSERDGELEQAVETTEAVTGCSVCGFVAELHDRRPTWVRDLPSGGRPVTIVWVKRVWRCPEPGCPVRTWTETSEAIRARASWTERARAEACRRVGEDGHSVAQVAAVFGVGWGTVMAAVRDYGSVLVDDPARLEAVTALGVDETAFLAANRAHSTVFVTGIVDLSGAHPRLLDVVQGRSGRCLSDWVSARPARWREDIAVAALD